MPTYDHICQNGHEFEEFQSMLAPPIDVCPICGAPAERRISGGTGLIFKGSGFYITDYAKKSSSGGGPSSPSSSPPSSTSSSTPSSTPTSSDKS